MRLQTKTLLSYGALAFPLAVCLLCLQVFVPTFYAASTGLSLSTVAVVLLIARLCDMVTDPMVGYLSDRTPASLGRRRIWVVMGLPLVSVAAWALFLPPAEPSAGYLLFWTTAIYLAGTMVIVPMNAWGAELSPDYQERSRVTGSRALFGLVGTLAALLVPAVLGHADARDLDGVLATNAVLVLVTLGIALILACVSIPDHSSVSLPDTSITGCFAILRGPSPIRRLLAAFLVNGVAGAVPATLFLFYITHVIGRPDWAALLMVCYFAAAAVSVPLWVRASRLWGKCASWRFAMVIASLAFASTPFLGPGDEAVFLVIVLLIGLAAGADLVLPTALQADLIDWDDLKSGFRRAGVFYAVWGTATKLSFALAIAVAFPLLDLFGFKADAENTPTALSALAWLYGFLPAVLKLAALALMRGYPITACEHHRIRQSLDMRSAPATATV